MKAVPPLNIQKLHNSNERKNTCLVVLGDFDAIENGRRIWAESKVQELLNVKSKSLLSLFLCLFSDLMKEYGAKTKNCFETGHKVDSWGCMEVRKLGEVFEQFPIQRILQQQMQHISQTLKVIIDQSLANKKHIRQLIINKIPIFYNIKTFISSYIQHLQLLIQIVNQNYTLSKRDHDPQSVIHLFELIQKREVTNLQQWKTKLLIVQNKFSGHSSEHNKFPDIFKDIDQDIEYYGVLRKKIELLIEKKKTVSWGRAIGKNGKSEVHPLQQNPQKGNEKYHKTNKFIEYYEKQYSIDLTSSNSTCNLKPESRQIGRIKAQCSTPKGSNKFRYQPISTKYTSMNNKNRTYSYNILDDAIRKTSYGNSDKYEQYRANLQKQMLTITKNEFTAENSKQNKRANDKHSNSISATTTNTNLDTNANTCQTSSNSKKPMTGKKYTYLFDNEKEFEEFCLSSQQKVKKRLFEQPHRYMTIQSMHDDCSQCIDQLGSKLQANTTQNQDRETKDLELILVGSLLSSKKWDFRYEDDSSNEDSEKDSLDELRNNISATGKFPMLFEGEFSHNKRDGQNFDDDIQGRAHPYRPVTHSLSKLNFSFGSR